MTESATNKGFERTGKKYQPGEIPFIDLKRQFSDFKYEIKTAINRVLSSGTYTSGPEVEAFESEFAAYCGVQYCTGVSNGRQAIKIALQSLGIHPGDEVVTVANAGLHSTNAIREIGAIPHFAEIEAATMTISLEGMTNAITADTRAVIVTHLHGQVANLEGLIALADQFNIAVIEDCFQAHGAEFNGRSVGTWGDIGCYGFSPTRNLGALGDAGAIITNDPLIAQSVREIVDSGGYINTSANSDGGNSRSMDEIQAAVLRAKLPLLDELNLKRRLIAQAYMINLDASNSVLDYLNHRDKSVFQHFVVRTPQREVLQKSLELNRIGWAVHYPQADHLNSACSDLGYLPGMLPETELVCSEVLSLPCYPELTMGEVEKVCAAVNEALSEFKD
jgi:dTDP-4-amino-4,6-dideoxygalactose transaminase